MKPTAFRYERPTTVADAVAILVADPDAKVIAGGQSLVPLMNFRLATPSTLIDLAGIDKLRHVRVEGGKLCVGARVTQREAERSELVRDNFRLLPESLRWVGHVQIRNRGTVCGSLAHGDPASELPAAAVAGDAELVATGPGGQRVIPAADFYVAPLWTSLEDDEILTEVRFPVDGSDARVSVVEYARRSGDFAIAGAAIRARATSSDLSDAAIAAFGVDGVPVRMAATEVAVRDGADQQGLAEAVATDVPAPTSDGQADGAYRLDLLTELVLRGLDECRGVER